MGLKKIDEDSWEWIFTIQRKLVGLYLSLPEKYAVSWAVIPECGEMMAHIFLVDALNRAEKSVDSFKINIGSDENGKGLALMHEKISEWEDKYGLLDEQH